MNVLNVWRPAGCQVDYERSQAALTLCHGGDLLLERDKTRRHVALRRRRVRRVVTVSLLHVLGSGMLAGIRVRAWAAGLAHTRLVGQDIG